MIKRSVIQRIRLIPTSDGQGGSTATREDYEFIKSHVSEEATLNQITQYGLTQQTMLNVVTDIKLDEYIHTRYEYNNKRYKLMRQVKTGNEYFSVLLETTE